MGCGSSSEAMQSVRREVMTRDNHLLFVQEELLLKKTWEIWKLWALV